MVSVMNLPAATHSTLPFWSDKNHDQKREYLNVLYSSLTVYAKLTGTLIPEIDINKTLDLNDCRETILRIYTEVLGGVNNKYLNYLNTIEPADHKESIDIEIIKDFVRNTPNIISQLSEKAHITASGLLIHIQSKKVLLHKHKKLGIWVQFGGHLDYELLVSEAALREVKEESGLEELELVSYLGNKDIPIDVDTHIIPARKDRGEHMHLDFRYLFSTDSPHKVSPGRDESLEYNWFTVEEILDSPDSFIGKDVKRLALKADTYFKYIL